MLGGVASGRDDREGASDRHGVPDHARAACGHSAASRAGGRGRGIGNGPLHKGPDSLDFRDQSDHRAAGPTEQESRGIARPLLPLPPLWGLGPRSGPSSPKRREREAGCGARVVPGGVASVWSGRSAAAGSRWGELYNCGFLGVGDASALYVGWGVWGASVRSSPGERRRPGWRYGSRDRWRKSRPLGRVCFCGASGPCFGRLAFVWRFGRRRATLWPRKGCRHGKRWCAMLMEVGCFGGCWPQHGWRRRCGGDARRWRSEALEG
jgi:hypothetical protein